ncbi:MAG: hypothetical protein V3V00_16235 [Saprospiraceae bacterium]
MKKDNYLIECVPNISEGRDPQKIKAIIGDMQTMGVKIINTDMGYDTHRTVMTIIGPVNNMCNAIKYLYLNTAKEINMINHQGKHPRLGAVDICPFIPFHIEYTAHLISKINYLAQEISDLLSIPVFLYANSSTGNKTKTLPLIRKGGYEALVSNSKKMTFPIDYGKAFINKKFGGTVMGVRDFMIAYNVNISTKDLGLAKLMAKKMRLYREKVGCFNDKNIKPLQILGWYINSYGCCQISTNIHNPRELSITDVFDFVNTFCQYYGINATSSELIGMMPQFSVDLAEKALKEKELTSLVKYLGLDFNGSFDWTKKILPQQFL